MVWGRNLAVLWLQMAVVPAKNMDGKPWHYLAETYNAEAHFGHYRELLEFVALPIAVLVALKLIAVHWLHIGQIIHSHLTLKLYLSFKMMLYPCIE